MVTTWFIPCRHVGEMPITIITINENQKRCNRNPAAGALAGQLERRSERKSEGRSVGLLPGGKPQESLSPTRFGIPGIAHAAGKRTGPASE